MLKTLGAQIKEYKWASIATPVFMLLFQIFALLVLIHSQSPPIFVFEQKKSHSAL